MDSETQPRFLQNVGWWMKEYPKTFDKVYDRWGKTSTAENMLQLGRAQSRNPLRRNLHYGHIFFINFGQFLGAGIIIVVGDAALHLTGPSVSISVLLAGIVAFLSTLTYAEMASSYHVSGAGFQYVMAVFGEMSAWVVGASSAIGYMCTGGSLARNLSTQVALLSGKSTFTINNMDFVAFGIVLVMTILVVSPTLFSSWLNIVLKTSAFACVLAVVAKLFTYGSLDNWEEPFYRDGSDGLFAATAVMYYAFAGKDAGCFMAEESVNPERDVPQAIIDCSIMATSNYLLMSLSLSLAVPLNNIADPKLFLQAPFKAAMVILGEPVYATLANVMALLSITAVLLIQLIVTTRLFLALARYNFLPKWLAHVDSVTRTPIALTLLFGFGKALVALLANPKNLRKVRIGCVLLEISVVAAAVIWRRYRASNVDDQTKWRSPGLRLLLISASSFAFGAAVHFHAPWPVLVWLVSTVGIVALSFFKLPQVETENKYRVHLVPLVGSAVIFGASFLLWQNSEDNIDAVVIICSVICGLLLLYFLYGVHVSTLHDDLEIIQQRQAEVGLDAPPYFDLAMLTRRMRT